MNRDQVRGRVRIIRGRIRKMAGRSVGNKPLEAEGKREVATGTMQAGFGDAMKHLSDLEVSMRKVAGTWVSPSAPVDGGTEPLLPPRLK